ncbi:MAG: C2H2-type zinc finger protein [Phycisphaerales bacterium]|nr:MAG: C2H2-type zinc finger protein [Phycisphaerales bacterium]
MAKSFRCTKCDRTFSMPAHLARHLNTIHRRKKGKKPAAGKAKKVKRRVGRPKGVRAKVVARRKPRVRRAARPVAGVSTRLLSDMRAYHGELLAQRASLDGQINAVATAMQALGVGGPKTRKRRVYKKRGRPAGKGVRAGSLKDYIVRVLRQTTRPMSPRDIGAGVVKAGFRTKAKDITKAVSNTLPQLKGIKKMGFGMYQLAAR